jgi:putative transposase
VILQAPVVIRGDQLLAGRDPNEVYARDGLLDDRKKALSERILNGELDEHLEDESTEGNVNRRNGHSRKSVLTGTSKMTLTIPRDRAGTFDPKLIAIPRSAKDRPIRSARGGNPAEP